MQRRHFLKGLALAGFCPICASRGFAAEGRHWSYEGENGPDHWGELAKDNAACLAGQQQSPINIAGALKADLPALVVNWNKTEGSMVNNGHTIQVNPANGGQLRSGSSHYELVQFHFHAPGEHLVAGKSFPMEVHFVHKKAENKGLGVLGAFMVPGKANKFYAEIAARFPNNEGGETKLVDLEPKHLLPSSLNYWYYEGSLTTPPCSEVVDWIMLTEPVEVAASDIAKFTAIYSANARPVEPLNRRLVLTSGPANLGRSVNKMGSRYR